MTTKTSRKLHLGPPQVAGPLAVYAIFNGESRLRCRSLAQATKHGAFVTEVDEFGSVNDVLVCNASEQPLLLYEGEVIAGAKQTRTIDQPVLVPAGVELSVSVSCVEQGRWEHVPPTARFQASPHAADPELRRTKRVTANARVALGQEGRPDQGETWRAVSARLNSHAVVSPSHAFTDIFAGRRIELDELEEPIEWVDGQAGAVVEIAGKPVVLDLVSRAEVFADLLPRLAEGYALQTLDRHHIASHRDRSPDDAAAEAFLQRLMSSRRRWAPTPGMGEGFVPTRQSVEGNGLQVGRELVALSAFPATGS